mmetsp:Transcript_19409/g.45157  ORF Transcript_19409/g.45157 Transcript_19409/m.45157 type:complete len:205 (+) Transcript_19409:132-746(+)
MGCKSNHCLPRDLLSCRFLCRDVWDWRWDRQGTFDVGNGCSPRRGLRLFSMHDSVYKFHCYNILCCLWVVSSRLRHCMPDPWLLGDFGGADWPDISDEKIQAQFLHCILHRRCRAYERILDDGSVSGEHGRNKQRSKSPPFRRHLWKRRIAMDSLVTVSGFQLLLDKALIGCVSGSDESGLLSLAILMFLRQRMLLLYPFARDV